MLNEFAYCPRLFHLEWVQGEFADNDETVEGRSVHQRVDASGGRLPEPDDVGESLAARSVMLDAPLLGMVAKIDLIEGDSGRVIPVERKRGRPRDGGGVWEPEELQVVAQALILRENGYEVAKGIVSYPQARARIDVEITPEREERLIAALADLRTAARGACPPPLVDSPKCPRCSLVGICLPDETHLLQDDHRKAPRRLITPRDDAAPLYVHEQGARVGIRAGRVEVRKDDEVLASLRPVDVAHVSLYGNVTLSAQALRAFCNGDVPVTHHSYGGWLTGVTTGPGHRNAALRIAQFGAAASEEASLAVAQSMVDGKIRNQRTLLRRNARGDVDEALGLLSRMSRKARAAESIDELLGLEGAAARAYFGSFGFMLTASPDSGLIMEGRNRRPPRDPVNALLSFAYSLLVRETTAAAIRAGMDPYVGVYHQPRYGRPALALDLAEEFRALIADSVVVAFINNGQSSPSDFIVRGGAYALEQRARKEFIEAFERRMATEIVHPLFSYRASYRRIVELQARLLARVFIGEIDEYPPFVTR